MKFTNHIEQINKYKLSHSILYIAFYNLYILLNYINTKCFQRLLLKILHHSSKLSLSNSQRSKPIKSMLKLLPTIQDNKEIMYNHQKILMVKNFFKNSKRKMEGSKLVTRRQENLLLMVEINHREEDQEVTEIKVEKDFLTIEEAVEIESIAIIDLMIEEVEKTVLKTNQEDFNKTTDHSSRLLIK